MMFLADKTATVEPDSLSATSDADGTHCIIPPKSNVVPLRNVSIHGPHLDEKLAALLCMTRALSEKVFGEDCLLEVTKKSGRKLTLFASDDLSILCGFIV